MPDAPPQNKGGTVWWNIKEPTHLLYNGFGSTTLLHRSDLD